MISPHRHLLPTLLLAITLALLGGCASSLARPAADNGPLRLTGFLEDQTIVIAPETGDRLVEVPVEEGDQVEAGQLLARLDDSLLQLQLDAADADIAEAEARLAQLRAAVRPEDVAVAQARVAQAEAALQAAQVALDDAILLRDHPQELEVQIAQAEAALAEAKAHARAAQLQAEAADVSVQMWGAITGDLRNGVNVSLPGGGSIHVNTPRDKIDYANQQWNLASQQAWAAHAEADAAKAPVGEAQATLKDLRRRKKEAQTAEQQVVQATNARDQARAALDQAKAALAAVQAGPTGTQIAAAEAAVQQARAAREALASQLDQTILTAPAAGLVSERYRNPGEVIGPHQRLLTLTRPEPLELTIFVPAKLLGSLQPDSPLSLVVDSAPGRRFEATVLTISDEPEFALEQSQNVAERAERVYAVRLRLTETDPLLRPGLPADVLIPPDP